ncbi:MAG: E3 binding domain-containing protein, partial [Trueperaceae bacterium]
MDPDIAPLAKRLAEENNVDWRTLRGSGTDGRIVERDVLDYLARVMAGDEDVNPTPEPVPDGVDAWPDADPGSSDAARRPAAASGGAGAAAAPEDDPHAHDPHAHDPAAHDVRSDDEDDGLLLAGDDLYDQDDAEPDLAASGLSEPAVADQVPRDHVPRDEVGREEAIRTPHGGRRDEDAGDLGSFGSDAGDAGLWQDGEAGRSQSDEAGDRVPDLFVDDHSSEATSEPEGGASDDAAFDFGGFPGAGRGEADEDDATDRDGSDDFAFDLGGSSDRTSGVHDAFDANTPAAGAPVAGAGAQRPQEAVEDGAVAAVGTAGGVHVAQLLRRRIRADGLTAVLAASVAGSDAADGAHVALGDVVYLAARESADRLDGRTVALAQPGADGRPVTTVPSGTRLREVAAAREAGRGDGDDAGLWVVDLSGYGLDEGRLPEGPLQLVVGRIAHDESGAHVWLTLAGEVAPSAGAAFLD